MPIPFYGLRTGQNEPRSGCYGHASRFGHFDMELGGGTSWAPKVASLRGKSAMAKALPKEPLKSPLEAKCCGSHLAEPILPAAGTRRVERKHSRDGRKCSCQRKGGLTLVETHQKAFATSLGCHEKRDPPNPSPMSRSSLTLGPF